MNTKPIWDEASERALLGAMLTNGTALTLAAQAVRADDFYRASHARVYGVAVQLLEQGEGVDSVTVANMLDLADDKLVARSVPMDVPSATNAGLYAEQVADAARRRRQVAAAEDVIHAAHNGGVTDDQRRRLTKALEPRLAGKPSFPVYLTSELATIAPPEFLLDGYLVAGGLNVKFGPSDRYKSFSSLDWSLSIASGHAWFGRAVRPGPVVYIAGEGGSGLWQRVEAWADSHGCDAPELHWITEAVNLFDQADAAALDAWIASLPLPPVLLVVDTVARCMIGGDENSSRDMGIVVANLDTIRHHHGAAVLAIHHTGHADQTRERGSSALLGAADCRIKAGGDEPLAVDLRVVKIKDAERTEPIRLHLEPVRRSLVIARASTKREARVADLATAITGYLSDHPGSTQNAIEKGVGMNRTDVRDTLMALVAAGRIRRDEGGNNSYIHHLAAGAPNPAGALGRTIHRQAPLGAPDARLSKAGAPREPSTQVRP